MAKPRSNQLFPSVGVLLGAMAAALFAVILVNVYIKSQTDKYVKGSLWVWQLKNRVVPGKKIGKDNLQAAMVPEKFKDAFRTALPATDSNRELAAELVAPRLMNRGDVLFGWEFTKETGGTALYVPSPGYEVVSLSVERTEMRSLPIQPGVFVKVYAPFDTDPDPKKADIKTFVVIPCIQVRTVQGRTSIASASTAQTYDEIGVELKESQAELLIGLRDKMASKRFTVSVVNRPDTYSDVDPKVEQEVVDRFLRGKTGVSEFPLN